MTGPAWVWPPDYSPAGAAEWIVETYDSIAKGFLVHSPFGRDDRTMIIRATRGNGSDGGVVTVALADSFDIDMHAAPVQNVQHSRTFFEDGA